MAQSDADTVLHVNESLQRSQSNLIEPIEWKLTSLTETSTKPFETEQPADNVVAQQNEGRTRDKDWQGLVCLVA